ncbi:hypothetical protein [Lysinibacillus capsici]|uniref:hypothetical protein n=1 Tax=Lysinibacillus capsici TaxID=2115968 RepID=UPI0028ABCA6B|nr:hypothetical protein [Lysinibacillus capsici]
MDLAGTIEFFTKYQPVFYLIGFTILSFSILIDNLYVTQLERKLMTPKQIFMYYFSQVFLMSIFTIVGAFLLSLGEIVKVFKEIDNQFMMYITIVIVFLLVMVIHSLMIFVVWVITFLTAVNYKYSILLEDGTSWSIIRMNKNNYLLVEKDNLQKFIVEPFNYNYEKEVSISEKKKSIFIKITTNKRMVRYFFIISAILIILSFFFIKLLIGLAFFLIGLGILLIITSLKYNSEEYVRQQSVTNTD